MSEDDQIEERLIQAKQLAKLLGLSSPRTICRWQKRGWLPYVRIGNEIRYDKVAIDQWIAGGGGPPVDISMPTGTLEPRRLYIPGKKKEEVGE